MKKNLLIFYLLIQRVALNFINEMKREWTFLFLRTLTLKKFWRFWKSTAGKNLRKLSPDLWWTRQQSDSAFFKAYAIKFCKQNHWLFRAAKFYVSIRCQSFLWSTKTKLSTPSSIWRTSKQLLILTNGWFRKISEKPWICAKRFTFLKP